MDACLQCCHLLKRACALSERHVSKALGDAPVNLSQAMLLLCVGDGHISSMSQLGKSLCCHKSNVTQIVDHLLDEKLIVRDANREDRRVQNINLTKRGRELVHRIHKEMETHASHCVSGLTDAEAETLSDLLAKYIAHTEKVASDEC